MGILLQGDTRVPCLLCKGYPHCHPPTSPCLVRAPQGAAVSVWHLALSVPMRVSPQEGPVAVGLGGGQSGWGGEGWGVFACWFFIFYFF